MKNAAEAILGRFECVLGGMDSSNPVYNESQLDGITTNEQYIKIYQIITINIGGSRRLAAIAKYRNILSE